MASPVIVSSMNKTTPLAQRFARNLDLIRHARQLDTEAFCRESGVSRRLLSLWRTGKHAPSLHRVGQVSENIGVDPGLLLAKEPAEVLRGQD